MDWRARCFHRRRVRDGGNGGCGLPGFLNFWGEITVFFGVWTEPALRVVVVLAIWGALIIGAVYMLRAVRTVMHGPLNETRAYAPNVADANLWRKVPYALLIASLLVFGFFPRLLTEKIKPVTEQIVSLATAVRTMPISSPAIIAEAQAPQTALPKSTAPQ